MGGQGIFKKWGSGPKLPGVPSEPDTRKASERDATDSTYGKKYRCKICGFTTAHRTEIENEHFPEKHPDARMTENIAGKS